MPKFYSRKEAAGLLGVSLVTLDRLRKGKKLSYVKFGDRIVITQNAIDDLVKVCTIPATALPTERERLEMAKKRVICES